MKTIRFAVAGTGNIANTFAQAVSNMENAEIAAVYSRSAEKANSFKTKYNAQNSFDDYGKMLESDFDILYIATPHSSHYPMMRKAIAAHKNVLCEKAFTLNFAQAEEIFSFAQQEGVFVTEAMCTPYLPAFKQMIRWINEGKIGDIKEIHANFHIGAGADRLVKKELAGGALLDVGVYPLMIINYLCGNEPKNITTTAELMETGVDYRSSTVFDYGDRFAFMSIGLDYNFSNNVVIIGDKGTIEIPHFSCAESIYLYVDGKLEEQKNYPHNNHLSAEIEGICKAQYEYNSNLTLRVMKLCDILRKKWNLTYPASIEAL